MRRSRPFWRLTPAEQAVWEAFPTGTWVDLRTGDRERDDPAGGADWGPERTVRAEVLCSLLLGGHEPEAGRISGVRLAGARIEGLLNLSDTDIPVKLHLLNCHLPDTLSLTDTSAKGVRLRGCDLYRLHAARAKIDGLLDLDGSTVRHGIRLDNAHVMGQLRLARARIFAPNEETRPLESRMLDILRDPNVILDIEYGHQHHEWALWGGGLTVDGGAFLRNSHAVGGLRLIGAQFRGGLYLEGTTIEGGGDWAVYADHLQAVAIEMSRGFSAKGTIRLRGARIDGVLSFDRARLHAPGRVLHLSHMQVEELILRPESISGEVNLGYSRIGVLLDDPAGWPEVIRLDGATYESLRGHIGPARRLSWLRRDSGGYRPQPYEQLAGWYQRIGDDHGSRRVLLEKQRARRATLRLPGKIWGLLLDGLVGYGYRPWLAAIWAGLLHVSGTVVFSMYPPARVKLDEERTFNAFIYTLDLLVPVSLFEQRGAWEPQGWTLVLANALIVAGWVLATALIAGATRVLRPSNSPN